MTMNETNNYVAPKGNYKLLIKDRNTGEEIMQINSENQQELIAIMEQYDTNEFSCLLTGNDIFLSE